MFNIHASEGYGRVLRRTWYMTAGTRPELRCRWTAEKLPRSTERGTGAALNQLVTKACDTESIAACA